MSSTTSPLKTTSITTDTPAAENRHYIQLKYSSNSTQRLLLRTHKNDNKIKLKK